MLRYLVEEMLAGRSDQIKGYSIGVSVLGRGEDFDPNSDPVVRLEARRLRHDLDSYYVSGGRYNPLRISIPKGQYVPTVSVQHDAPAVSSKSTGPDTSTEMAPNLATAPGLATKISGWWTVTAIFAGLAILAGLGYALTETWRAGNQHQATLRPPAIALLPLEVLSSNEEDRFLALGISNRIVSDLQRFPDLRIYAPRADVGEASKADPVLLGERLGVSFILAGGLRSSGSVVDVHARLIDAKTGEIIWSDYHNKALVPGNLFAIQDEISSNIATTLGHAYGVIKSEITGKLPDTFEPSMSSYECVLRGYAYRRVASSELHAPALECMEKALQHEPEYAEGWAMLAYLYLDAARFNYSASTHPGITFETAAEAGAHAIALDPHNVQGLKVLSAINHYQGNFSESERLARRALELNPNEPDSLVQLGWRLAFRGNFEEGVPLVRRAIERSVEPPGWYYHTLALDRLMKGDGKGMLLQSELASIDGSATSQSLIAAANGLLGNRAATERAVERMHEIAPDFDPVEGMRVHHASEEILQALSAALSFGSPATMMEQ